MKKSFFRILFAISLLIANSCSKDYEPNFHFVPLQIVSADLPEFFSLNQTYQIRVTYNKPDACTSFSGFDVTPKDVTTRNVVVIGTKRTDQETCDETPTESVATFGFVVQHFQTYIFRFWQGEDANGEQQYFEVEVPVI